MKDTWYKVMPQKHDTFDVASIQKGPAYPLYVDTTPASVYKKRKIIMWAATTTVAVGVHTALYVQWYSQYNKSKFHWFNDDREWLQMDKLGHAWSASAISKALYKGFEYSGYSRRKSAIYSGAVALGFQAAIEYFDGFSVEWGASKGDLIANLAGTLFASSQNYFWGKNRVPMRMSFHHSNMASIRPNMLGSNLPERMLKDYNGQTYWLAFMPTKLQLRTGAWPKWLGFHIGYSADGMVGGDDNIWVDNKGIYHDASNIIRYRRYLLSPAISFNHLPINKKLLKAAAFITDHVRIPMPALEYNSKGQFKGHWLYF